jgi:hypothetical protein
VLVLAHEIFDSAIQIFTTTTTEKFIHLWIDESKPLKSPKGVIQPDFMISRRWHNLEAAFLDYKDHEHPVFAVYCRPEAKGAKELLKDRGKVFKALREIAELFQLSEIFAVITNFSEWQFC